MKLTKEIRKTLKVGDESFTSIFREPTTQELNEFLGDRYEFGRKGKMKDRTVEARAAFYDLLLIGLEDLEDAEGKPVGPDRKELVRANWKSTIIFSAFEDMEVDEKN